MLTKEQKDIFDNRLICAVCDKFTDCFSDGIIKGTNCVGVNLDLKEEKGE